MCVCVRVCVCAGGMREERQWVANEPVQVYLYTSAIYAPLCVCVCVKSRLLDTQPCVSVCVL